MTTLLSIETSGSLCSLALHGSGRWFEDTQNVDRMHNMLVLGMLDELFKNAQMTPKDLDVVAFAAGPGSFTGVRIAASLAQGVAFAVDARVLPVSSSRALATEASKGIGSDPALKGILTITRSRRDAYYLAGFERDGEQLIRVIEDVLHLGASAPQSLPGSGWIAVGDRPGWWPEVETTMQFLADCTVTARTVGRLAMKAWSAGGGLDPAMALPRYVSGDSPWRRLKD
jgi:tRNA threonylcarbamoyladenosine biosynthesis protein TsaB